MSRTLSGSLTGRAAVTAAREFREDLQIEAARERARRAAHCFEVCQDIRDMMTQEQYDAWHEAAPETGFYEHAQATLAKMQAEHAVIDAQAPDPLAESREIAEDVAAFGGQPLSSNLPMGDFTLEDAKDWQDQITELRGGL